jgi:hypothetical protein
VLVPVVVMSGVTMPAVEVVDMVAVRDRIVAAPFAMDVIAVVGVIDVHLGRALVPVSVMEAVGMAVVEVVHMVAVGDGHVPTVLTMGVVVSVGMCVMSGAHREVLLASAAWVTASATMCATCSSASEYATSRPRRWVRTTRAPRKTRRC